MTNQLFKVARRWGTLAIAVASTACQHPGPTPTNIYFSDHGTLKIQNCRIGTWETTDIVTGSREVFSMKIDNRQRLLFYTLQGDRKLFCRKIPDGKAYLVFDGSKQDYYPCAIDLDTKNKQVYVYCKEHWVAKHYFILRVPYEGGPAEEVMQLPGSAADIVVDSRCQRIYWFATTNANRVWCPDDKIIASANELWTADLRHPDERICLIGIEKGIRAVKRAVLDPAHCMIYWTQNDGGWANDKVRRSDLRGVKIEDLAWNESADSTMRMVDYPWGMAIDNRNRMLYWADINMNWLARVPLHGGKIEVVLRVTKSGNSDPHPTGLDLATGP